MPSPKDGSECTLVPPADAAEAHDADTADPGAVEDLKTLEREQGKGKYGSQPVDPYVPPETPKDKENITSWVEILLVDEDNNPIPGETYKIVTPDNKVKVGTLNALGMARVDGIPDGTCQISFPKLDADAWIPR